MAEELTKKKRVRGAQRTAVKKIIQQAEAALTGDIDAAQLTALKLSLTEKKATLATLDDEVINLLESEQDISDDIIQSDEYKHKIYTTVACIESALRRPPTPVAPPTDSASLIHTTRAPPTDSASLTRAVTESSSMPGDHAPRTVTHMRDDPSSAVGIGSCVRLPKLTIHPFDGDITKWISFWDSFESAIHNNGGLSEVDKFNYLRSLVERTARDAISGLTLTAANYKEAIQILQRRFSSKQHIISRHMNVLLNLDPVTSTSAKALCHLYDRIESNIRGLKSLGVDSATYGSLLSPVLLGKLPSDVRLVISRKVPEEDWTLDALLENVELEVVAREWAGVSHTQASDRSAPTAATLFTSSNQGSLQCCYCQQGHSSSSCKQVVSAEDRKGILRRAGHCYVCLRREHVSRNCCSSARCYRCRGKHHSSICTADDLTKDLTRKSQPQPVLQGTSQALSPQCPIQPSAGRTQTGPPQAVAPGLNPQAAVFPSTNLLAVANQAVLLQTALVKIYNPERPQEVVRVRLILDSGSQRSYISRRAKEALHLIPEGECQLAVATFGGRRTGAQRCEIV